MKSECRACGKIFGGLTGFDTHRVGRYIQSGPDYGRRCLTDQELNNIGYTVRESVWKLNPGQYVWGKQPSLDEIDTRLAGIG